MSTRRNTVIFNYRKGFQPLQEAFENLGFNVVANSWTLDPAQADSVRCAVVNLYEAIRQPWRAWAFHRQLQRAGIPLIAMDRDAPWHMGIRWRRLALFRWLNPVDVYASHTLQPTWNFGRRKIYSPNAVWVRNFNLHGASLEAMRDPAYYEYDVSFLGNMDGQRYKEHAERERFFAALCPRLAAMGVRYYIKHSSGISEDEQIRVIQRSRINLSFRSSCDHGGELSWGLPERCYGVPARGGFLLTDRRRHAGDDFELGKEWADYEGLEDCLVQIRYWLDHFEESRALAEAAHHRVMRMHTYEDRARNLLNQIATP
ncbi:MAG: hypothetical protein RIR00_2441 [Pseudomonadota bacterium]|jgi:spore maturation protein CgeB